MYDDDKVFDYLTNDPTAGTYGARKGLKAGFPIYYCDESYPESMQDDNVAIQEFPNGNRFLISIDFDTREITQIRQISSVNRKL